MADSKQVKDELVVFRKRLSENSPIFVSRTEPGENERYQGVLFGSISDELLIIGRLENVQLAMNESIVLRMVIGSHLIGFQSSVVKEIKNPSIYLVRFPVSVEAISMRKTERVQAFFPAEVTTKSKESDSVSVLQTRIIDISTGGCCFGSKTKLPANSDVSISFTLPGHRQVHSLRALVLSSTLAGTVYNNRARFPSEGSNIAVIREIGDWVGESLSFVAK
ncbi:MAG: PilZ domain-containing protein [Candidatus Lambdaproteobacteria bacterium]|nr:PilZ domain-containing protein [Candidatus Lambdaproteobacteria bacterium]